jgi:hypothetical protein
MDSSQIREISKHRKMYKLETPSFLSNHPSESILYNRFIDIIKRYVKHNDNTPIDEIKSGVKELYFNDKKLEEIDMILTPYIMKSGYEDIPNDNIRLFQKLISARVDVIKDLDENELENNGIPSIQLFKKVMLIYLSQLSLIQVNKKDEYEYGEHMREMEWREEE